MCVMTPLRMASISGAWTAESEDGAEFRANTAELLTQLRLLDEMEEISIKNIL